MDISCAQFIDFQETLTRDHQKPAQNLIRPEALHTQIQADTCVLTDQDLEDDCYFNSLHAGNFHKVIRLQRSGIDTIKYFDFDKPFLHG